jgi:hypothetical protein
MDIAVGRDLPDEGCPPSRNRQRRERNAEARG